MVQPLHCKGLATLARFPKTKITVRRRQRRTFPDACSPITAAARSQCRTPSRWPALAGKSSPRGCRCGNACTCAFEIDAEPLRRRAGDAVAQLAGRRQQPGTQGAQPAKRVDQGEFDRVPVRARQHFAAAQQNGLLAAGATFLHVAGDCRGEQQRHVAVRVVEHIGFDRAVEAMGLALPAGEAGQQNGAMPGAAS